jgi:hypothetical protein
MLSSHILTAKKFRLWPVGRYRRFGETYWRSEDGNNLFLRNAGIYLKFTRRPNSEKNVGVYPLIPKDGGFKQYSCVLNNSPLRNSTYQSRRSRRQQSPVTPQDVRISTAYTITRGSRQWGCDVTAVKTLRVDIHSGKTAHIQGDPRGHERQLQWIG